MDLHKGRTYVAAYVHFVWSTAKREPIITPDIERRLHRYIQGICQKLDCKVLASGGTMDHMHLLVSIPPTVTLATIMEQVKGSSSHFASEELLPDGWFAWQEGYGAITVSPRDRKMVVNYINNQKQRHAVGNLWPRAEHMEIFGDDGNPVEVARRTTATKHPKAK